MGQRNRDFKVSGSLWLFSLLLAVVICQGDSWGSAPEILVPLDQPVEFRLKELHAKFSNGYSRDFKGVMDNIRSIMGSNNFISARQFLGNYMVFRGDLTMKEEMLSLARANSISFEDLAVLNYLYEASCTTIIGRANDGKTLIFGSNLDFGFSAFIRKYSYQGLFTKKGQTVFVGAGIYGLIGVLRGQRINNGDPFAISINERREERTNLFNTLNAGPATNIAYFIRKTLQLNSYEEALERIMTEPLSNSAYYTIGGTYAKGGCVVERSAKGVHSRVCIDDNTWFLVVTNHDRDKADPSWDYRRVPTEIRISKQTRAGFTAKFVQGLLSSEPLKRRLTEDFLTIYTVVCQNAEDSRQKSTWLMRMWDYVYAARQ